MLAMERSSSDASVVIRALRLTGDELQLNRVLWALCDDPAVAKAFCESVLRHAEGGTRRLDPPPADVRSVQHRALSGRVKYRRLRHLARKSSDYVDLEFRGDGGWHLQVEIKIDSGFGETQLDRYSAHGPLAAIVRAAGPEIAPSDRANWVGVVAWRSLLPDLRALPVAAPASRDWQQLLDVMEADGDFASERRLSEEVQATHDLLVAVRDPVGRWAFLGSPDPEMESRFLFDDVRSYLGATGSQNPVKYVHC